MQNTELKPVGMRASMPGGLGQRDDLLPHSEHFQEAYDAYLQRAAVEQVGPGYTQSAMIVVGPQSRTWVLTARTARLAAENDRFRAQETFLLDQLAARNAELAARDAEIRELKTRLATFRALEDEVDLPTAPLTAAFQVRTNRAGIQRLSPAIHPDDLDLADE